MPATSPVDAIGPAFRLTKRQLFSPFRFSFWLRVAVLGLATGEFSSAGGFNFSFPGHTTTTGAHGLFPSPNPMLAAGAVATMLIVAAVVALVWIFISSVYRFVLFETILTGNLRLRAGWTRWFERGTNFFLWNLLLMFVGIAGVGVLIGLPLLFALPEITHKGPHMVAAILLLVVGVLLFLAWIVILIVTGVISKDFLVPIMALEQKSFVDGWRELIPMLRREKGNYIGYLLLKMVLAIGAAFAFGIAVFFVLLIALLPVGGLGFLAVLGGKLAGLTWNAYTITLAVTGGLAAVILLLLIVAFVMAPVTIFFPAYSVHYFAGRYPELDALLNPPPPAQPAAPPEPPPAPAPA